LVLLVMAPLLPLSVKVTWTCPLAVVLGTPQLPVIPVGNPTI
jgi:hypothetical protein